MNKLFAIIIVCILGICGLAALAEDADTPEAKEISCLIDEGSFVIQIPAEDDPGWWADDLDGDDSVVRLYDADVLDGTFVARYDPVGDGDVTVGVYHYYNAFACDEAMTWDLHVADGAVQEVTGGSHTMAPVMDEIAPYLVGEWLQQDTQFAQMTIEANNAMGLDVEIVSPLTHGAYVFKTTIYPDCGKRGATFAYDKGKYWEVPITDGEETELGEAKIYGATGGFTLEGDEENLLLYWQDDDRPEDVVVFERASKGVDVPEDTSEPDALSAAASVFATDASKAWDSFLVLAGEAGQSLSGMINDNGLVDGIKDTAENIGKWAGDTAQQVQNTIEENRPAIESWVEDVKDRANESWDGLTGIVKNALGDYTYYPEIEAFIGTWQVDDYTLEIVHMDDEYALVNCIVTKDNGDNTGVRWIYDSCSYDNIGGGLSSREIGMKFDIVVDDNGELLSSEEIYNDGAACFWFNDEGKLLWEDFKEMAGEEGVAFERVET